MLKRINLSLLFLVIITWSACLITCPPVSAEVVDRIVAIVNNDIVTLVQLNKETAVYKKNFETAGYDDDQKQKMIDKINEKILNALIDQSLTRQEAEKYHITVSENTIDNAVKNVMESKSLSQEEFEKALKREGLSLTEYRKNIKKQILQSQLINHAVKSKVIIMESDIKFYYKNNMGKYSGQKKYHLRNILMSSEDKFKEVSKKLNENQSFSSIAQEYSIAPNAKDGGDLGLFDIKNFPENIKEEISKLIKGQHTDVISTSQGFQIFYVDNITVQAGQTYDQVHDAIHKILYNIQVEKKFKTWLESLKKKAHIKIML
jgi:peptidyl-prolyl cis-trans isomerase SurA